MPLYNKAVPEVALYPGETVYLFGFAPNPTFPNPFGMVITANTDTVDWAGGFAFVPGMVGETINIGGENYLVSGYSPGELILEEPVSPFTPLSPPLSFSPPLMMPYFFPSYNPWLQPQYEVVDADTYSIAFTVAAQPGFHPSTQRNIRWEVLFASQPSEVQVDLQESILDNPGWNDDNYVQLDSIASTKGGASLSKVTASHHYRAYIVSGPDSPPQSPVEALSLIVRATCL